MHTMDLGTKKQRKQERHLSSRQKYYMSACVRADAKLKERKIGSHIFLIQQQDFKE